jgi:hypothetical protein
VQAFSVAPGAFIMIQDGLQMSGAQAGISFSAQVSSVCASVGAVFKTQSKYRYESRPFSFAVSIRL